MENKFNIGELELFCNDDNRIKRLVKLANYIMAFGRHYEKKGHYNEKMYDQLVKEIRESQDEWQELEGIIFGHLENYVYNGIHGKHSIENNDICLGTLKLIREAYKTGVDLSYLSHSRLKSLIKRMEAIQIATYQSQIGNEDKEKMPKKFRKNDKTYADNFGRQSVKRKKDEQRKIDMENEVKNF